MIGMNILPLLSLKDDWWKQDMETKMRALEQNQTWDKCGLPYKKQPIKYEADGTVER